MTTARYIRIILILFALLLGVYGEAWAQLTPSNIILDEPFAHGTVSVTAVDAGTRTVTLSVTPASGYYVNKSDIVVQKLVDPSAPNARRRVPDIANALTVSGNSTTTYPATGTYTFIVPADYAGALVSVTFTGMNPATATVTPNSLVYTGAAQPLVTLGAVVGGAATDPVTYSLSSSGTYTTSIPTATDAGTYTVYYKVAGDATHSEGSGSVTVTIQKATITQVILAQSVQTYTDSPLTFSVSSVKAGTINVPEGNYTVSGNTQTDVGSYTLTVTAVEDASHKNFTGTATASYRIVGDEYKIIYSNTAASEVTNPAGTYILAADVSASVFSNLSSSSFTGTLDGDFHKVTELSSALFGTISGGTVKNVMLEDVSVSGSGNVGAIAKEATGDSRIYNCGILSGSVGGSNYVGGLVGLLDGTARVINCFSYATITGGTDVGGIVGYNNGTTKAGSITTMVMNCMFYGDITGGSTVSPVYGGNNIGNLAHDSDRAQDGLNTFNYYAYDKLKTKAVSNNKYNSALAVEERYLNRFEFYRLLLNSNKKLAAFYITGDASDSNLLAKWVLETADRTITNPYPYPILKAQGRYPSIINYDAENAPATASERNNGGKLGTLSVTISSVGSNAPAGATITNGSLTLTRTDKDFDRFNFNYDKVQLPYYNDVGTGNYTGNRVVTGWKITAITAISGDPYTASNYPATGVKDYPDHNYADRRSSNKDLYTVSKRVFSQGAYFDVPYGVESITIEPYWAKAVYMSDLNYDVVYKNDYSGKQNVSQTGTQMTGTFDGQKAETSITRALDYITSDLGGLGPTVYDNALVLVGNYHLATTPLNGDTPFTMMSVDTDKDHEPDCCLIYHHINRSNITPIRFDFLAVPGTAQAQKPNGASLVCNFTIFKTRGWFEVTNTAFMYSNQLEYENGALDGPTKIDAPLILLGGIFDQFVSTQSSTVNGKTIYIHLGGNLWIDQFGLGTHSDGSQSTPHVPVSVTGGEYEGFYLTGTYNPNAKVRDDNAECYISGGHFKEVAGACQEQLGATADNGRNGGDVHWQIYNADIDEFFGGGINDAKPVKGNITTDIYNSHVTTFCGGPKFGNMSTGKTVTTTAEGCVFGTYFGAGYGGNSYSRKKYHDKDGNQNWNTLQGYYTGDKGKYYDGATTNSRDNGNGNDQYGKKGPGVATDFDHEFFVWSSGKAGARFFVKFVSFSLAQCGDVSSTLKKCEIEGNFYGGGSLGKVSGTATSELEDCTVNGDAFGAGYSATLPPIPVRTGGFTTQPVFNSTSGMFDMGVKSGTANYEWKHKNDYPSNGTAGFIDADDNYNLSGTNVVTTVDISSTNLGSVGSAVMTLKGNTTVARNVYGGGDASAVNGESPLGNATVTLQGNTRVGGNVYGGGNHGMVSGSTKVEIKE